MAALESLTAYDREAFKWAERCHVAAGRGNLAVYLHDPSRPMIQLLDWLQEWYDQHRQQEG